MQTDPIFIGGLANTGKTELRLILEAHPHLCFTRRTYMWRRFYQRYGKLDVPANLDRCLAQMLQNKHIRALEPDVNRIRREFLQGEPSYARLFGLFHQHHAEHMGKARWGDQLGSIEHFAAPIFAAFPRAKMIQMIRNPRDIYAEANARARQRLGKVGWLLAEWLDSIRVARRNAQQFPEGYLVVTYEALISRPEQTVRTVFDFIGEDFDKASRGALETHLAPVANQQAIDMSPGELAFVQHYARQELATLGYTAQKSRLSLRDQVRFCLLEWPANRATMLTRQTFAQSSA